MMIGLGEQVYDYGTGSWMEVGPPAPVAPPGGGGTAYIPLLTDVARGTMAIVGNVFQRPTYETHQTPSGSSTIIRTGGGMNYPGGGAGPTSVPVAGVSTTTMLLLGLAAMGLVVMMAKRQ